MKNALFSVNKRFDIHVQGSVVPDVLYTLSDFEKYKSCHEELGEHHPASTFTRTFSKLGDRLKKLLDSIDDVKGIDLKKGGAVTGDVEDNLELFLSSMSSLFDDYRSVLKCVYRANLVSDEADRKEREAFKNIKKYKGDTMELWNKVKHDNKNIRCILLHNGWVLPGFFIEGLTKDGAIGPDHVVHSKRSQAISLNHFLALQVCGIFYLSESLNSRVMEFFEGKYDRHGKNFGALGKKWYNVVERVSQFEKRLYEDENYDFYPLVRLGKNTLSISYPVQGPKWKKVGACSVKFSAEMDVANRTLALPYYVQETF